MNTHAHKNIHSSLSYTHKTRGYLHKSVKKNKQNVGWHVDHRPNLSPEDQLKILSPAFITLKLVENPSMLDCKTYE